MSYYNTISDLAVKIHETARAKGWWPGLPPDTTERRPLYELDRADRDVLVSAARNVPELIALMHSELSEALEEYRKTPTPAGLRLVYFDPSKPDKPEGFPIELADVIIRILDTCEAYGIDIEDAIARKMLYNETRPFKHGGKAC